MKQTIYVLSEEAISRYDGIFTNPDGSLTKELTQFILNHKEKESFSLEAFVASFNSGYISDTSTMIIVQPDEANDLIKDLQQRKESVQKIIIERAEQNELSENEMLELYSLDHSPYEDPEDAENHNYDLGVWYTLNELLDKYSKKKGE